MNLNVGAVYEVPSPEQAQARIESALFVRCRVDTRDGNTGTQSSSGRSVLGQAELDELLSQRDKINLRLQEIIDRQTDPWGIKVTAVEVEDVILPDSMKRAMAGQAESERERRAMAVSQWR
jgi:SPFH domain / Band 7 family